MVNERAEFIPTSKEQELRDLLEQAGQRTKELLTQIMKEKAHLFRNTSRWDTGIILGLGTPNERLELKPILTVGDCGEGSLEYYYLTEEGIFVTYERCIGDLGYYPVWDRPEEVEVSDYVRFADAALDEIEGRQKRFSNNPSI